MARTSRLSLIVLSALVMLGCRGLEQGPAAEATQADLRRINHVVVVYQENRTFDNYFSSINAYRATKGLPPSADVPTAASNPNFDNTAQISAFKMATVCHENVSPAWNETHVQMSRQYLSVPGNQVTTFPMDGFVYTGAKYARDQVPVFNDTEGRRAIGYYDETHLPYYYYLATQFAMSDRWFSPVPANSPPNRLFTYGATSEGFTFPPNAPMAGKPIFQLLQEANVSWKIYVTDYIGGDPNQPVTYLTYYDTFYQANKSKVRPIAEYFTDLQGGTLPAVAFIESGYASSRKDEHPSNNIQEGAAYIRSLVEALRTSTAWQDSVFILSFDEGGGVFDHVPPPAAVKPDSIPVKLANPTDIQGDFDRYGLRVPFMLVSPFARPGFVSHTVHDHTAVLKLIETRWGLPSLTLRDAAQTGMLEFFDFSSPNLNPAPAPLQPTNGPCYYDHLP